MPINPLTKSTGAASSIDASIPDVAEKPLSKALDEVVFASDSGDSLSENSGILIAKNILNSGVEPTPSTAKYSSDGIILRSQHKQVC